MRVVRGGLAAGLLALTVMAAGPGAAHGGGGGGGGGGGNGGGNGGRGAASGGGHEGMSPREQSSCGVGYVRKGEECVRVEGGVLPDRDLYEQGRVLALAGRYAEALPLLAAVRRTDDPMVFTMRGFAMRKLGDVDGAMVLYQRALAIDPGNVDTHEYMGEGYVVVGRLDLARAELAAVRRGCGSTDCEQYEDLARAIETGRVE